MSQHLSVIICTHNPRRDYLEKVLSSLRVQTLPKDCWELLLIDNASNKPLDSEIDLSWHPHSRQVREDELGLTPARLRGIAEASAETLVFVDDDNVLDPSYLEVALQISKDYPFIGAWGGQILPEFEVPPPEWTKPYWGYLALREVERDQWSNLLNQLDTTPYGAGVCIRKVVAERYAENAKHHPVRSKLGRRGASSGRGDIPLACEDIDMAYTACDLGLCTGLFAALKLTHLIPKNRLTKEYLSRLVKGATYSRIILESLRDRLPTPLDRSLKAKISEFYRLHKMHPHQRQLHKAIRQATVMATQKVLSAQRESFEF
ncbi:glycosyltransferase [Thermocoleostomius sinensis]|jgi:glycosyltransferase involved in cell wall biosynthesis|uniref:Glycosyltransferase n=1 Tax=Thermocoleostomius sinensis A174 TaxID=2016057 RepID=A0A9E8ZKA1_9CYAN|nr:glycosyltransferase [Thermocoleostomius sinensis]WAL62768.1 glycosyltransferase [Thermocoleostomius sinensis A174]